eukprot:g9422.t1
MRQLVFRMVAWDADARPSAVEVLDELDADQWASGRHNPFLGTCNSRSPQFASMLTHLSAAHNPYIEGAAVFCVSPKVGHEAPFCNGEEGL